MKTLSFGWAFFYLIEDFDKLKTRMFVRIYVIIVLDCGKLRLYE